MCPVTPLSESDIVCIEQHGGIVLREMNPEAGDVRFLASDGSTTLLFQGDGKVFIRGEQVDDNREVCVKYCVELHHEDGHGIAYLQIPANGGGSCQITIDVTVRPGPR